jgi:drug/metabolite transporter (DMT)-like permease
VGQPTVRGLEAILFAALGLIWGSTYLAIEVVGSAVGPLTLVALRLGIGAAMLALVVRGRHAPLAPRGAWPHIAVVAITGLVVPFSLIAWSQRDIDAGLASIFSAATPLFTIVLASLVISDEPMSLRRLGGVLVGFAGVVVVVSGGINGGGEPAAMVAMVGAVGSYAVTAVWTRRFLRGVAPVGVAAGQVQIGFVVTAVLAVALERPDLGAVPANAWAAIGWLGLAASGLAPVLYFRLIERWGASRTAVVNYLIPVVGVGMGAALLGEALPVSAIVGGVVVIAGVTLASGSLPLDRIAGRSLRLHPAPNG